MQVFEWLEAGENLDKITFEEYLHVSFLQLMDSKEVHVEETIMHGGNLYSLHTCVSGVSPNQPVAKLRNIT